MSYFQITRIFREYPFLNKYWRVKGISTADVKRFNEEMLSSSGKAWLGMDTCSQVSYLFTRDGRMIGRHPKRFTPFNRSTWTLSPMLDFFGLSRGVRLGDVLAQMKDKASEVYWVVQITQDFIPPSLTLYKPPKNFSNMAEWLEAEQKKPAPEEARKH